MKIAEVKKIKTAVVGKAKKEVKKWCDATVTPLVRFDKCDLPVARIR